MKASYSEKIVTAVPGALGVVRLQSDSSAVFDRLGERIGAISAEIETALPKDLCADDPVLAERRRSAFAALSAISPHYQSEGTVYAAVRAILASAEHAI